MGTYFHVQEKCVLMSINSINSVSLYQYYYTINKKQKSKLTGEKDPVEIEMISVSKDKKETKETSYQDRPWADLMYQLNISFNPDPKDDIADIKNALAHLIQGIDDEELTQEVEGLVDYVENLYLNYQKNSLGSIDMSATLGAQLNNLSILNQANLL